MAKGGGGSWKVAYADFVTAMMAFFLVMWIGAQDQKTKQSVANYFIDPSGASKKPAKAGSTYDSLTYGAVPNTDSVAMGRGRNSYTNPGEPTPSTKSVSDWLHTDKKATAYWKEQAARSRDVATGSEDVREKRATVEEAAARELSKRLREEVTRGVPTEAEGVYQDLLFGSLADVNWTQIAQDLLLNL